LIGRVQEHLEAIYDIRCELRAQEFLVTPEVARSLGASGLTDEELLVRQVGDALEIALYVAPELLEALERFQHAPGEHVVDGALASYVQVAEGVSHFLYLAHSAGLDRRVSLLELEAQAEIDKFASCVLSCWKRGAEFAAELLERLFERVSYRPHLRAEERARYEHANRLSRAFCRRLLRHVGTGGMDRFLADLRYAYRLGAEAKLRHLAQVA
jgi:hypothetical protein